MTRWNRGASVEDKERFVVCVIIGVLLNVSLEIPSKNTFHMYEIVAFTFREIEY